MINKTVNIFIKLINFNLGVLNNVIQMIILS